MDKYVSLSKIVEDILTHPFTMSMCLDLAECHHMNRARRYIAELVANEEPEPDVVKVVRCRDCIRADEYGHCEMQNYWGTRDDFCSRGERR